MMKLNGVRYKIIFSVFFILNTLASFSYAKSTLTQTGDILQIAIPVAAAGISYIKDDMEGEKQFAKSFITNMAITNALKFSLKSTELDKRPNGGHYSFPSGHSAAAFGGAFYLQQRYGIEYGAPAIALASLTGYSRIKGDYHHWRDVIGGTIIAFATNYFIVSKYKPEDLKFAIDNESVMVDMKLKF